MSLLRGLFMADKILNEEVAKLQNQLQYGLPCNSKDRNNDNVQLNMLEIAQVTPEEKSIASTRRMVRKRSREAREKMEEEITHGGNDIVGYNDMEEKSAKRSSKGTVSCGDLPNDQQVLSVTSICRVKAVTLLSPPPPLTVLVWLSS